MTCINGLDSERQRLPGGCLVCGKEGNYVLWCDECIKNGNAGKQAVPFIESLSDPKVMHEEIKDLHEIIDEYKEFVGAVRIWAQGRSGAEVIHDSAQKLIEEYGPVRAKDKSSGK